MSLTNDLLISTAYLAKKFDLDVETLRFAARSTLADSGLNPLDFLGGDEYLVPKDEALMLAMQFDDATRRKIVKHIKELESRVNKVTTLENTYAERLEHNYMQVPVGYFSVMTEVHKVFHEHKLSFADFNVNRHPDKSAGRHFSTYLKNQEGDFDHVTYPHYTGRFSAQAKAYPEEYLPLFRKFLRQIWFPKYGMEYIKTREVLSHD